MLKHYKTLNSRAKSLPTKLLKKKSIQSLKLRGLKPWDTKHGARLKTKQLKPKLFNGGNFLHKKINKLLISFYNKDFKIIGPKPSKLTHLKTLNNLNWKFWHNTDSSDFYMLKPSNLKVQNIYGPKFVRGGTWVFKFSRKYYNSKLFRLKNNPIQNNFTNFNKKFKYINSSHLRNTTTLPKLNKSISLRGVKRLQNLYMFKTKLFTTKPLHFTNNSVAKYRNLTNLVDDFLSQGRSSFKRVKRIRGLKKFLTTKVIKFNHKKLNNLHNSRLLSYKSYLPKIPTLKVNKLGGVNLKLLTNSNNLKPLTEVKRGIFIKNPFETRKILYKKQVGLSYRYIICTKLGSNQVTKTFKLKLQQLRLDSLNILTLENSIALSSRHKLHLTFLNLSMFLSSLNMIKLQNINEYKYTWRKKINSFIQPNEYRNSLFFRKKKTFINNIFKNQSSFNSNFLNNRAYNSIFIQNNLKNSLNSTSLRVHKYTSNLHDTNFKGVKSYNRPEAWLDYKFNITYRESRINRVRFKPGYQNIWRRVRGALKEYLNLRYIYQQQLTKYLSKFYIASNKYLWGNSEMSLYRVFIYSRLLPDKSAFDLFWGEKFIFLNGLLPINKNTTLSVGDVLQLVVSINYYIMHRWLVTTSRDRGNKLKRLVYKKGLARKYKIIKQRKQKSYYTPTWIYKNRFDFSDVKCFLEVDYFTLSAIVLYTPYLFNYHSYDNQLDLKINTFRLYNWKYIT